MKNIKIKDSTHVRLAKNIKLKSDTFDTIINRGFDVYERIPEIRNLVGNAFRELLNACTGNMEKTERIKAQLTKVMDLLTDKVN